MKKPVRRALGSDVLAPHPVDLYAAPSSAGSVHQPRHRKTPRGPSRPQLNALLDSWDEVCRFRATAYICRLDLRDVLLPALKLFEATRTVAERRAIAAEAKRLAGELTK